MALKQINLLPQDVREKKKQEEVRTSLGNLLLIVFIIVAFVSAVSSALLFQTTLSQKTAQNEAEKVQGKIKDLGLIEEEARRLDTKMTSLEKIVTKGQKFSVLLEVIGSSTPQEVTITNLSTFAENKVSLNGYSSSYFSLSRFATSLVDQAAGGKVFSGADLTSASLDEVTGKIRFSMTAYLKERSLR